MITISDGGINNLRSAIGDFDGDGSADLVVSSDSAPDSVDVWFGPLQAGGDYTPGTSTTRLVGLVPSTALASAGDVDGDGSDDLLCGGYVVRVPTRGSEADVAASSLAGGGDWLWATTVFGDFDSDGWQDVVRIVGDLYVTYGPLVGDLSIVPVGEPVPADGARILWDSFDCWGASVDVLPDSSGDGHPELRAGGQWFDAWDPPMGCARNPHAVWSIGDSRGRELTQDDALVGDLPMAAALVGDVDGDGTPDLVTNDLTSPRMGTLYSLGEAISTGITPAPLTTAENATLESYLVPGDLDGDGGSEVVARWNEETLVAVPSSALLGSPAVQVNVEGTIWDPTPAGVLQLADLTGDGVLDLVFGPGPDRGPLYSSAIIVFDGVHSAAP